MRRYGAGDRFVGILLGLVIGLAIVALFVFVFSEDAVDAPSIDETPGNTTQAPVSPGQPGTTP